MDHAGIFQRVVLLVLDSVGIGEMPDAAEFGDAGRDRHLRRHLPLHFPFPGRAAAGRPRSIRVRRGSDAGWDQMRDRELLPMIN